MASFNAYEVLGVHKLASTDEIKERFRLLMLQRHPDKNRPTNDQSLTDNTCPIPAVSKQLKETNSSADHIELLVQARNILCDAEQRKQLDTQLDAANHFEGKGDHVNLDEFTKHQDTSDGSTTYALRCRCGDSYEVS